MFVVFDLDGTLALNEHRQHFVDRPVGEKDWKSFFAACHLDEPNMPAIQTLNALFDAGHEVEIWTGRSGEVLDLTLLWLHNRGLRQFLTKWRRQDDHTPDHVLKKQWLDGCERKPDLVFDDRASVVAMWRANGIPCFQVAPGEF